MEKLTKFVNARRENVKDFGFSLLELTVAVGILLIMTVGGLLAYDGISENAREAEMNQMKNSEPVKKNGGSADSDNNNSDSESNGFGNDQPGPETNEDREKGSVNK